MDNKDTKIPDNNKRWQIAEPVTSDKYASSGAWQFISKEQEDNFYYSRTARLLSKM